MAVMTGKKAIMEIFRSEGVEYVFGIPGATEVLFMDALEDCPDIKYILGLHESVAVAIAEGYARASGKVGVLNLHTLAGLSCAMGMICNASNAPLVITAGQQDTRALMQEPELGGDLTGLVGPFTKWGTEVAYAADIPIALRRAFKIAAHPPAGPVFVSLPQNVLAEELDLQYLPSTPTFCQLRPDREAVNRAAELLSNAQMPVILVGSGVADHDAMPEAVGLAELVGARVYQPSPADMNFPTAHPQCLGGLDLGKETGELLRSVDVLVAIGTPLFQQSEYVPSPLLTPATKVIQIDSNSWQIGKNFPVTAALEGDIKLSLGELINALQQNLSPEMRQAATARAKEIGKQKEALRQELLRKVQEARDNIPISPWRLMQDLRESVEPETVIVDDSWSCSRALRSVIDFSKPKTFYRLRAGGSIGWGIPASLGVKLACPDRRVVAVVGDGSAIFTIQSLWVAAHYHIPVTFIVCSNACYRLVRLIRIRKLGDYARNRTLGSELDNPRIDFCQVAQGLGVQGRRVERPDELKATLRWALESDKPALVEVEVEATV